MHVGRFVCVGIINFRLFVCVTLSCICVCYFKFKHIVIWSSLSIGRVCSCWFFFSFIHYCLRVCIHISRACVLPLSLRQSVSLYSNVCMRDISIQQNFGQLSIFFPHNVCKFCFHFVSMPCCHRIQNVLHASACFTQAVVP